METLAAAVTHAIAPPSPVGGAALWPSDEPQVGRWPAWACLTILVGASAMLWAVIGWTAAFLIMKLA